jgi:hypothetical protein
MFTDLNLSDVWTCYKAFRREVLGQIDLQENRFGVEQEIKEITCKIAGNGWRVYEVPISYYGRTYAEGKKITWKDGLRGLWCILRYSLKASPATETQRLSLVEKRPGHRSTKILLLLFLLTLPLVNPWVRGDGVGYYAYVRSLLVEHKLDFANDWRAGNLSFTLGRVHADGTLDPRQYSRTGRLDNHFAVGPSILWTPFVAPVHLALLTLRSFGARVNPNGFSRPYIIVMALATALYGFLGLYLSFRFACLYTEERWALLATLGIWFASSFPVYMYFNPSWSHAHSVFIVAAFLWYWQRTRQGRTPTQWVILGLISGLVLDVYYINVAVLLVPLLESLEGYWHAVARPSWRWLTRAGRPCHDWPSFRRLFAANLLYCCATLIAFLPTLISRKMIYGHSLDFGYENVPRWRWASPYFGSVLFSSDHGLLLWTPILILAVAGIFLFLKRDRRLAAYFITVLVVFCYLIGGNPNWDGISSFGNRFFISLTPLFVLGLAVLFSGLASPLKNERAALVLARSLTALLILWNSAFIFQWGVHMVPARGPISWKQMVRNQFAAVPQRAATAFEAYFHNRGALMQQIEQEDVRQLKEQQSGT